MKNFTLNNQTSDTRNISGFPKLHAKISPLQSQDIRAKQKATIYDNTPNIGLPKISVYKV